MNRKKDLAVFQAILPVGLDSLEIISTALQSSKLLKLIIFVHSIDGFTIIARNY